MLKKINWREPYRYLFSAGTFAGLIAVALWVFFYAGLLAQFPRAAHAHIMYFGFFWSFVAGFLMTAVPKMTRTLAAGGAEILLASGFVGMQVVMNLVESLQTFSVFLYFLQLIFLLHFGLRRIVQARKIPFPGFVFVPAAFLMACFGVVHHTLTGATDMQMFYLFIGEAFLLNLIFGVGSRLVPFITRLQQGEDPTQPTQKTGYARPLLLLFFLNGGFFLTAFVDSAFGYKVVFFASLLAAFLQLKIAHRPRQWSASGIALKVSVAITLIGIGMLAFDYGLAIAARHLVYLGGFTLTTVIVASRVMLAHAGLSLDYELRSPLLIFVACALVLSGVFRLNFSQSGQLYELYIAATAFMLALLIWGCKFVSTLFSHQASKC